MKTPRKLLAKIQGKTLPELRDFADPAADELAAAGFTLKGEKRETAMSQSGLISSLMAWYLLRLKPGQRITLMREAKKALEELRALPEPYENFVIDRYAVKSKAQPIEIKVAPRGGSDVKTGKVLTDDDSDREVNGDNSVTKPERSPRR